MDLPVWVIAIGALTALLMIVAIFAYARKRSTRRALNVSSQILTPAYVEQLHNNIYDLVERHIFASIEHLTHNNQLMHEQISRQAHDTAANYIADTNLALAQQYEKHNAELSAMFQHIQTTIETRINALTEQIDEANSNVQSFNRDLEQLRTRFNTVNEDLSSQEEQYQQEVAMRVASIVDNRAVDVLANYLNESMRGIDFGEYQDTILSRLEENKDALKEELGL